MKKLSVFFITILICVYFINGCADQKASVSVTAYSLVSGSFLGEVTLSADESGKINYIRFEEYYMPTTLFKVANYSDSEIAYAAKQSIVLSGGGEEEYVKYIDVDGENFTLYTLEYKDGNGESYSPKRYTIDYKSDVRKSLNSYIVTDEGAKWYVGALLKGRVTVGKKEDKKYIALAEASYRGGVCKSSTGYWSSEIEDTKGWALNIQLIQTQLLKEFNKGKELSFSDKELESMRIDSGATMQSFNDYAKLAYKACNMLVEK